ncbi:MAG: hypothetical protein KIT46_03970 [Anaerolineales bacterium]|nr:hypothetical protein [Anaerolineales bacterium]MCW5855184.1 hypothetical protein [Anaerolineales bacterium]
MGQANKPGQNDARSPISLALLAAAALAGLLTVAIIFLALFAGLWLDNYFAVENHMYTFGLVCASVPVTLMAMLWVTRVITKRFVPTNLPKDEEDAASG